MENKFRGVTWDSKSNCYRARINVNKKHYFLGYFDTLEAGANAISVFKASGAIKKEKRLPKTGDPKETKMPKFKGKIMPKRTKNIDGTWRNNLRPLKEFTYSFNQHHIRLHLPNDDIFLLNNPFRGMDLEEMELHIRTYLIRETSINYLDLVRRNSEKH